MAAILGMVLYPAYRVEVRGRYLDHVAPWATNTFDIKENLALVALPLCLAAWYLARMRRGGSRAIETIMPVDANREPRTI